MGVPVPGDIDPPAQPYPLVLLHMIEEARQGKGAARPPSQAAVQPKRHHLGRVRALGLQEVKGIA